MTRQNSGRLYLVPTFLETHLRRDSLPEMVPKALTEITLLVVENAKTARQHLKQILPEKPVAEWTMLPWNKHGETDLEQVWLSLAAGRSVGIMSEAGCPGFADPGADIVVEAHRRGIEVVPLVGPSSLILALMASGFSGQSFQFHGYLAKDPSDLKRQLQDMEKTAGKATQIWIETPFRNQNHLQTLLKQLNPQTQLCIACDLLDPHGWVRTQPIAAWRKAIPDLAKKPCIFLLGSA